MMPPTLSTLSRGTCWERWMPRRKFSEFCSMLLTHLIKSSISLRILVSLGEYRARLRWARYELPSLPERRVSWVDS